MVYGGENLQISTEQSPVTLGAIVDNVVATLEHSFLSGPDDVWDETRGCYIKSPIQDYIDKDEIREFKEKFGQISEVNNNFHFGQWDGLRVVFGTYLDIAPKTNSTLMLQKVFARMNNPDEQQSRTDIATIETFISGCVTAATNGLPNWEVLATARMEKAGLDTETISNIIQSANSTLKKLSIEA